MLDFNILQIINNTKNSNHIKNEAILIRIIIIFPKTRNFEPLALNHHARNDFTSFHIGVQIPLNWINFVDYLSLKFISFLHIILNIINLYNS